MQPAQEVGDDREPTSGESVSESTMSNPNRLHGKESDIHFQSKSSACFPMPNFTSISAERQRLSVEQLGRLPWQYPGQQAISKPRQFDIRAAQTQHYMHTALDQLLYCTGPNQLPRNRYSTASLQTPSEGDQLMRTADEAVLLATLFEQSSCSVGFPVHPPSRTRFSVTSTSRYSSPTTQEPNERARHQETDQHGSATRSATKSLAPTKGGESESCRAESDARDHSKPTEQRPIAEKLRDIPKPSRPLTAYNIFFKHERLQLVKDIEEKAGVPPCPTRKKQLVGIPFSEMGRKIGSKWKELSVEEKRPFEEEARLDKLRYTKEKEEFDMRKEDAWASHHKNQMSAVDGEVLRKYYKDHTKKRKPQKGRRKGERKAKTG